MENNQINYRTKQISDKELATKLYRAVNEMFAFLAKNNKDYSFYNRKWQVTSTELVTQQLKSGQTYSHTKSYYGWIETETKLADNNSNLTIVTNKPQKTETFRSWTISTRDISTYSYYTGGVDITYKLFVRNGYDCVGDITKFIKVLPKRSKKKLIKMIYLYELKETKDFYSYERLFFRLRDRFDFKLSAWSDSDTHQFELIKPTFTISGDRNRKINRLLKFIK